MRSAIFLLSALMIGILLFGCVANTVSHNGENNVNVQPNATVQPEKNVTAQPGALEFSVPSELPVAYVGKPYLYSFCDPQSETELESFDTKGCGLDATSINPKGGTPPYEVNIRQYTANISKSPDWSVSGLYASGRGLLNFTPKTGDEGQYVLEVCASDSTSESYYAPLCRNTTLYIMSDTVTVKGEGELTHYLLLKLNSDVKAADFRGNEDVKTITTRYAPTANFSFTKVTAEVPAASSCVNVASCGGGSHAGLDVTASATGVSVIADGSAACGRPLGPNYPGDYEVDYYHFGYAIGYGEPNVYIALNITNTGTKEKAIDVYLNVSSELDPGSQKYFKPATANAIACIGGHCVSVPNAKPGDALVNSTVLRVLVRPGSHLLYYVGSMKDSADNTNMLACPSFVKASSSVSVTIVPADMSDGKKAIGSIYSYRSGNSSKSDVK